MVGKAASCTYSAYRAHDWRYCWYPPIPRPNRPPPGCGGRPDSPCRTTDTPGKRSTNMREVDDCLQRRPERQVPEVSEKDYLELMRDLAALRRTQTATTDPAIRRLDHTMEEHDGEVEDRAPHPVNEEDQFRRWQDPPAPPSRRRSRRDVAPTYRFHVDLAKDRAVLGAVSRRGARGDPDRLRLDRTDIGAFPGRACGSRDHTMASDPTSGSTTRL